MTHTFSVSHPMFCLFFLLVPGCYMPFMVKRSLSAKDFPQGILSSQETKSSFHKQKTGEKEVPSGNTAFRVVRLTSNKKKEEKKRKTPRNFAEEICGINSNKCDILITTFGKVDYPNHLPQPTFILHYDQRLPEMCPAFLLFQQLWQ